MDENLQAIKQVLDGITRAVDLQARLQAILPSPGEDIAHTLSVLKSAQAEIAARMGTIPGRVAEAISAALQL